jgi:predicted GNAT family N-acyltransferase
MSTEKPTFRVEAIDYEQGLAELRAVRETVFVQEQNVPIEEEWDALDPQCLHVIARDDSGLPIGTGRLTPEHRVGRMAVLPDWRGRGVGDALLAALVEVARQRGWRELALNAQVSAFGFYARHGFVPYDARFHEAGIEHQAMRRKLEGATEIETRGAACGSTAARSIPACWTPLKSSRRYAGSAWPGTAARSASCCRTSKPRRARMRR